MKKTTKILITFILLLVMLCSAYLIWKPFSKEPPLQHIVLITIDTLRADHMGSYGYIRNTSPFLDSLVDKSILFKNMFAPMSTTSPSHAALFTSLYPMQIGMLVNGHKLDDQFVTIAETFRDMGYKTAAIVSTRIHFRSGNIAQGFEFYDQPSKTVFRRGKKTIDLAIEWLNSVSPSEKTFLWIHLFDPHAPYQPDESYYNSLVNSLDHDEFLQFVMEEQHSDLDAFKNNDKERMFDKISLYDAEIRDTDAQIQRFYQHYQETGFDTDSLWAITSDHGEGLGNHHWWQHGKHIYNEQLRVPLILYFSSGLAKGKTVEKLVENVDIYPTLFELITGEQTLPFAAQGESLVPFLSPSKDRGYSKLYAFGQRRSFGKPSPEMKKKIEKNPMKVNYEAGKTYSLQSQSYKYIYRTEGTDEFFDLQQDPYELHNLAGSHSPEEEELRGLLLAKIQELQDYSPSDYLQVDEKTIKGLKSLGYVQ